MEAIQKSGYLCSIQQLVTLRRVTVAEIEDLQNKLIKLARGGFKHHTAICEGHVKDILQEAFTTYLGYDWVDIDK